MNTRCHFIYLCLFQCFIIFSAKSYFSYIPEFLPEYVTLSSGQFSLSVVSDFLRPHELQHARPPCPSPTPGVHSDSLYLMLYKWDSFLNLLFMLSIANAH